MRNLNKWTRSAASLLRLTFACLVFHWVHGPAIAGDPGKMVENNLGMQFVYIRPGMFLMGSPVDELMRSPDEVLHPVHLTQGFFMQTTEVTQGQWRSVMGQNPSKFDYCGRNCPVENVSWEDVRVFIDKLNAKDKTFQYRLPTEAEWEYACRAGTTTPFYFGEYLSAEQANYNGNHPIPGSPTGPVRNTTVSVGMFQPNDFGLFDMHGNVYEWCQDWYGPYPQEAVTDPQGPRKGSSRVCRGGGLSSYARRCRSANRTKHIPGYANFYIGFRLVASAATGE